MTNYTPDSLRELGDDDIWPVGTHEIRRRLFAHADAWEADLAFANENGTSMNNQLIEANARIEALEAANAAMRERVEEAMALLMTAKLYMPMPQVHMKGAVESELRDWWGGVAALASLPSVVPSSDDVGTTHDPPEPDYQPDGSPEPNHRRSAQRAVGRFADPDEPCPPGDYD